MPKEKVKKRLGDIRFKTGGEVVRRSVSTRKLSVRKLENFESVREQFEQLKMSTSNVDKSSSSAATEAAKGVPTGPVELGEAIAKVLLDREKPLRILKTFSNVTTVSRQILAGVQNKVNVYTQINDSEVQLDYLYSEWLDCCGKSPEELEKQSDPLRPSLLAAKFDET